MKLFANLRENLHYLVSYEDNYSNENPNLVDPFDVYETKKNFNFATQTKNWIHYFKPKTKQIFYADLSKNKKSPSMEKINLTIDKEITNNHRSIIGSDGHIYYIPHHDEKEDEGKNIFM